MICDSVTSLRPGMVLLGWCCSRSRHMSRGLGWCMHHARPTSISGTPLKSEQDMDVLVSIPCRERVSGVPEPLQKQYVISCALATRGSDGSCTTRGAQASERRAHAPAVEERCLLDAPSKIAHRQCTCAATRARICSRVPPAARAEQLGLSADQPPRLRIVD